MVKERDYASTSKEHHSSGGKIEGDDGNRKKGKDFGDNDSKAKDVVVGDKTEAQGNKRETVLSPGAAPSQPPQGLGEGDDAEGGHKDNLVSWAMFQKTAFAHECKSSVF